MATKLDLLLSFATGQGIAGGLSNYVNYPGDHDSNYSSIQTSVNQMIDEINAARLIDAQIPLDLLLRRDVTANGRHTHDSARVTRSGQTVIISNGRIYANGRRMVVIGQTIDYTALANGTYYISVDSSGVLYNSTIINNHVVDIVTVVWTSPTLLDTNITDNLFNGGRTFLGADAGFLQQLHIPPNQVSDITTDLYPGRVNPSVRYVGSTGTLGDAGIYAEGTNEFTYVSQRAGGAGVGATVRALRLRTIGQLELLEQARVFAERIVNQSIPIGAGFTPITFDTPIVNSSGLDTWRREPAAYFTNPFIAASGATLTIPTNAALDGTYLWTAQIILAHVDETVIDARIIQTVGGAKVIARGRVAAAVVTETAMTLVGYMDMVNTDAVQLQITHNGTGAQNVTFARLCGMLIGGAV